MTPAPFFDLDHFILLKIVQGHCTPLSGRNLISVSTDDSDNYFNTERLFDLLLKNGQFQWDGQSDMVYCTSSTHSSVKHTSMLQAMISHRGFFTLIERRAVTILYVMFTCSLPCFVKKSICWFNLQIYGSRSQNSEQVTMDSQ